MCQLSSKTENANNIIVCVRVHARAHLAYSLQQQAAAAAVFLFFFHLQIASVINIDRASSDSTTAPIYIG